MNSSYKILKLKALLKEKNYTQQKFADLIHVSLPTVRNWFNGRSKIDIDMLEVIAKRLSVSPCYFFDEVLGGNINNGNFQFNNSGDIKIKLDKKQDEIEKLKAELSGCRSLLESKDEVIKQKDKIIHLLENQLKK